MQDKSTEDDEDLILFIHKPTGLQFAGDGPFLFDEFLESTFIGEVVPMPDAWTTVTTAVHISYIWFDQEHFLYVSDINQIPDLFKLIHPERKASIMVHPNQFDSFLRDATFSRKHALESAVRHSWGGSPL